MNATRPAARNPRGAAPNRSQAAVRKALRGESVSHEPFLAFGRTNGILVAAGLAAAGLGFVLLSRGDTGLAPFLIVVGYCALIPLGIIWRDRPGSDAAGKSGPRANSSAG